MALGSGGEIMPDHAIGSLEVTSPAFRDSEAIPMTYTTQGDNISIPLEWNNVPEGVKSFAVITDDPDAPSPRLPILTFVHWVIYDIPAGERSLEEGIPIKARLENGTKQGKNGYGKNGFGGIAPVHGEHRYFFKVYALDSVLGLDPAKTKKKALIKAMDGHILSQGQIIGTYIKQK